MDRDRGITEAFIRESNKIDPQYDITGEKLIPGAKPGDPMYDNTLNVINLFEEWNKEPITKGFILDIHRVLTKGIGFFENRAYSASGRYRDCNVYIGGEQCPHPVKAQQMIEDLISVIVFLQEQSKKHPGLYTEEEVHRLAWNIHNEFETAHPFIDGNGRTGRLLFNFIMYMFDSPFVVFYYYSRRYYYEIIREYKLNRDKILQQYPILEERIKI